MHRPHNPSDPSLPGRPRRRGKIERVFRTINVLRGIRMQFLAQDAWQAGAVEGYAGPCRAQPLPTTPRLEASIAAADARGAIGILRRSLAIETACIVVILGLVAQLGMLEPPFAAM